MQISASNAELVQVPVVLIKRNPENPRLVFRPAEMDELLESIRKYGVQVPIAVYRYRKHFVLIDGERRWKCCMKLNKETIPALIQQKPDALTNLLLMFNIHALREQWDLLTIALKLPRVIELLTTRLGRSPNERELAAESGLARGVIRRSKLLMELPQEYKDMMLKELNKPKPQQKITEDLFIEMERALTTVQNALPDLIDRRNRIRRVLIDKYRRGVITNIVHFRMVAKIARAEKVEVDPDKAGRVLNRLFKDNDYSIEQAYEASVADAYTERDVLTRIRSLIELLENLPSAAVDEDIRDNLRQLIDMAKGVLRRHK